MVNRVADLAVVLADLDEDLALEMAEKLEAQADLAEKYPVISLQSRFEIKSS
jgi:hypothetical protein